MLSNLHLLKPTPFYAQPETTKCFELSLQITYLYTDQHPTVFTYIRKGISENKKSYYYYYFFLFDEFLFFFNHKKQYGKIIPFVHLTSQKAQSVGNRNICFIF